LSSDGESVFLFNGTTLVDSVTFGPQAPDLSIGRVVDGIGGWQANTPTPNTANTARSLGAVAGLRVNEWMASPSIGEDWFEIHNTDSNPVALGNLYLSDTPGSPLITRIPALSFIAGKGFTRFWADGTTVGGNHCNFKLSASGENLLITQATGSGVIDQVTFGAQTSNVSQGRLLDGATTIVSFPGTATPAKSNYAAAPIVINEVLAHSEAPKEDAVELFNPDRQRDRHLWLVAEQRPKHAAEISSARRHDDRRRWLQGDLPRSDDHRVGAVHARRERW
jgi:hypothetical protein